MGLDERLVIEMSLSVCWMLGNWLGCLLGLVDKGNRRKGLKGMVGDILEI